MFRCLANGCYFHVEAPFASQLYDILAVRGMCAVMTFRTEVAFWSLVEAIQHHRPDAHEGGSRRLSK